MALKQVVGLISDTHGLLRPEAISALSGSDFIMHAGDIGNSDIIARLGRLAPVTAIRGNVDKADWVQSLPASAMLEVGGSGLFYMLHSLDDLHFDPATAGFRAVISGHSHRPGFSWKDGVLYVNPGSAGPRRFSLPVSIGRVFAEAGKLSVEIVQLVD